MSTWGEHCLQLLTWSDFFLWSGNHSEIFIIKKHLHQRRRRVRENPGTVGEIRQLSTMSPMFGSMVQWRYFFWEPVPASAFSCSFCCSNYRYLQSPGQKSLILGLLCLSSPPSWLLLTASLHCCVSVLYSFNLSLEMDIWAVSSLFLLHIILQ